MKTSLLYLSTIVAGVLVTSASAQTISQWTFETSIPATAGPFSPEVGSGSALGLHAGAATYSSPAGNGSVHSFSVNTWAVGDYFQFNLGTVGYSGIGLSFDQTSSGTGPRDFSLQYSTDGTTFTPFASYAVLANASPNPAWNATTASSLYTQNFDLSGVTSLNNAASIYFRLVNTSTVSAAGGTVAAGGTDRVDNFTVYVVPEPGSLLAVGGLVLLAGRKLLPKRA